MRPVAFILAVLALLTGAYGLYTVIDGTSRNSTREVMNFPTAFLGLGTIGFAVILAGLAALVLLIEIAEHLSSPSRSAVAEPPPYSQEEAEREAARLTQQRGS